MLSSIRARATSLLPSTRAISTYAMHRAEAAKSSAATGPTGLTLQLSFVTAAETIVKKPVFMVTIPTVTGVMGIAPEHCPTIAQLKPGVVLVHGNDINDVTHKYFVSGGFAVVKADSTATVTAVEAIKLEDLDVAAAKKGLDDANALLAKATGEREKAEAQIGVEINEAIIQALEAK